MLAQLNQNIFWVTLALGVIVYFIGYVTGRVHAAYKAVAAVLDHTDSSESGC
jgi:hypothetical protein